MRGLLFGLLLASAVVVQAQQFCLKDNRGKQFGPFELKEGATVTVGRAQASISKVMPLREQVFERMRSIIIPRIDFKDTDVREAIAFLQKASVENDPLHRGVEMALDLTAVSNATPSEVGGTNAAVYWRITLAATGVSVQNALAAVCTAGALRCRITDGAVVVGPLIESGSVVVHRSYRVVPAIVERITRIEKLMSQEDVPTLAAQAEPDLWKRFFGRLGVEWPCGSSIEYMPGIGRVFVANSLDNLAVFEQRLSELDVQPSQIEIELQFMAFEMKDLAPIAASGITPASLTSLWAKGQGQVLAALTAVTQSGVETTVKGVTEYRYPAGPKALDGATTNQSPATNHVAVASGRFLTREVGAILQVLPEVSEDGDMICVTLAPEFVEQPDWRKYRISYVDSNGKEQQSEIEQPFFHAYSVSTSVMVANGRRVRIGGGMPSRDGKKLIYTFVTARLIGLDGEPIRPRTEQARGGALEL